VTKPQPAALREGGGLLSDASRWLTDQENAVDATSPIRDGLIGLGIASPHLAAAILAKRPALFTPEPPVDDRIAVFQAGFREVAKYEAWLSSAIGQAAREGDVKDVEALARRIRLIKSLKAGLNPFIPIPLDRLRVVLGRCLQ
jgi:hypothetical protein